MLGLLILTSVSLCAQDKFAQPLEDTDARQPILIQAASQQTWRSETEKVTELRGGASLDPQVTLVQGELSLKADLLVIVERTIDHQHDVVVYAQGQSSLEHRSRKRSLAWQIIKLRSMPGLDIRSKWPSSSELRRPTAFMKSALARMTAKEKEAPVRSVSQTVTQQFDAPEPIDRVANQINEGSRRIQIRPRTSSPLQFDSRRSRDTVPEEQIYVITGGVNVLIDGVTANIGGVNIQPGVLDLSADRIVVWTQPDDVGGSDLQFGGTLTQPSSARFQVYMEGNILIRQAGNIVTASHAFMDVATDRALLLNAELKAQIPETGGVFRVRAEKLRQLSRNRFQGQNGWTTTSPYGKPGYRVEAAQIFVEPGPISPFTELDPFTGQPKNGQPLWVTALDTRLVIGDTPVLSLPRLTAPAEDPNIPIRSARIDQDRIFGFQVKTVWNLSKILGRPNAPGMDWELLADYLTERGPGIGVRGHYDVPNRWGQANGEASIMYQFDDGDDNLGADRLRVAPEQQNRGHVIIRHRQKLPGNASLFGEFGLISDRNYQESFHENLWDTDKDAETLIGGRQDLEAWSASIFAKTELNDFENSTEWYPKADLFGFSQPVFGGLAYWSSHSSVGYADLNPAEVPPDITTDPFTPLALPYIQDLSGTVAVTRHQIDAPFSLGWLNVRPFALGEAAYWDEGLQGDNIDRFVFNGGVEAHVSATKVLPFVRSDLFNLNGLAHKSDLFLTYSFTDSSRDLDEIAQFNEFDDNNTERFRNRFTQQIFPGLVPNTFDPRNYAVRQGAGLWTSAPYHELVDDQEVIRLKWRNRWQTKSGAPGNERIRDWMLFETGLSYFPQAERDNFGEDLGLIYANYQWNISDRTSILADGIVDLFDQAQEVWSVGVLSQRNLRGSMYVGFRAVTADEFLDSQTFVASYSYRMSPKWIATGAISYDVADGGSRGSSLTFSRVGLDWILHFGFGVDASKDNVGAAFSIEPRFGPPNPTNLSRLMGIDRR
ncbi:MAG: hypothetical protein ABJZ55_15970 [Fuerstiella sp.]